MIRISVWRKSNQLAVLLNKSIEKVVQNEQILIKQYYSYC